MARSTADQRYRVQRLALGADTLRRKRVYLDTCFWVRIRKHISGAQTDERIAALLEILKTGVAASRLVCPIEGSLLIELFKQTDSITRRQTAKLMDELSQSTCLAPPEERRQIEVMYFLRKHGPESKVALHEPREFVWTRVADVFGTSVPDDPAWDDDIRAAIQTGFQDHLWTLRVEDLVTAAEDTPPPNPNLKALVTLLNEGKVGHQQEVRSLVQLESTEMEGGLEGVLDLLIEVMAHLTWLETGVRPAEAEIDPSHARGLARLIVEGYRKNALGTDLPSLTVPARLHASWRWDPKREYRENDLPDLWHASAALPYCTAFLTDGDLASSIRKARLDQQFDCIVAGSVEEALNQLNAPDRDE